MTSQITVTADTLRRLHRIHTQLQELQERLDRGPRMAAARENNVAKLLARLDEVRGKAKTLRMATDAKNLQLQGGEAAVARRKQQLHEAKDNREYQALKEQIAADEMANSVLADEILEAMERLDAIGGEVKEAEAVHTKGCEEAQKANTAFEQSTSAIRGDIGRLQDELSRTERELPGDFAEMYRRLIRSKGSDAMAPLEGEFCRGCNQHVPLNMINALRLSQPVICRSCGRLLYLPEDYELAG